MGEHGDGNEPVEGRPAPDRRFRASILDAMGLVAAVAVAFRWPGLGAPVGLSFLYLFARHRGWLDRPTRVALGQVALAVYLPTTLVLYFAPVGWWDQFTNYVSMIPSLFPAALFLGGLGWVADTVRFDPAGTPEQVILSLAPLPMIGVLVLVARRGLAWRIACLILAASLSALSTVVFFMIFLVPT